MRRLLLLGVACFALLVARRYALNAVSAGWLAGVLGTTVLTALTVAAVATLVVVLLGTTIIVSASSGLRGWALMGVAALSTTLAVGVDLGLEYASFGLSMAYPHSGIASYYYYYAELALVAAAVVWVSWSIAQRVRGRRAAGTHRTSAST